MIGKTVNQFKILKKLGEGGKGMVYKAFDTKLERDVAIKFLPPHIASNEEERKRFAIEAKAAAGLNHNNIATIHNMEETDGETFIVMEYIDGQELKEKIAAYPLPIDETLRITTQIAEGLQAAHEKGVVHRDIKSSNIMLTAKGDVKIMDFGIAKLTGKTSLTKAGSTLGTVAYMSPEQVQGKTTDHRSDIWALGVVIYEMLTGQLPFKGDYDQAVMFAIVTDEPEPVAELRRGVPMELERTALKCLEKSKEDRYQSAGEILVDLRRAKKEAAGMSGQSNSKMASPSPVGTKANAAKEHPSVTPSRFPNRIWAIGLGAAAITLIAVLLAAAVWGWLRPESSTPAPLMRFQVPPPQGQHFASHAPRILAFSHDGRSLVYVATGDEGQKLYLRRMDVLQTEAIPGTEGASTPFFSPDDQWIGFFAGGELKKVPADGGATPVRITDAAVPLGATWGRGDVIVYTVSTRAGLFQVSALGGEPKTLTTPNRDNHERSHRYPSFLPDGRTLLFYQMGGKRGIWTFSLESGERKFITDGMYSQYLPAGYLVFDQGGSLYVARFDLEGLKLNGKPFPVISGVAFIYGGGRFAVSGVGSLAYFTAAEQNRQLVVVDRDGNEQLISDEMGLPKPKNRYAFSYPRFSPNGDRVAFNFGAAFWIYDFGQKTPSQLPPARIGEWAPDGQRLAVSARYGSVSWEVFSIAADLGSEVDTLAKTLYDKGVQSWSRDGQWHVYVEYHPETSGDIWAVRSRLHKTNVPILGTPAHEDGPKISPDANWLAYSSDETGRQEVYVIAFPEPSGRFQISAAGGKEPVWSPDGGELYYWQDHQFIAASLKFDPSVGVVQRTVLFEKEDIVLDEAWGFRANYDIHPNGDQFIMVKEMPGSEPELIVVLNWEQEIMRLDPEGN